MYRGRNQHGNLYSGRHTTSAMEDGIEWLSSGIPSNRIPVTDIAINLNYTYFTGHWKYIYATFRRGVNYNIHYNPPRLLRGFPRENETFLIGVLLVSSAVNRVGERERDRDRVIGPEGLSDA
jgi:hypothetical protein